MSPSGLFRVKAWVFAQPTHSLLFRSRVACVLAILFSPLTDDLLQLGCGRFYSIYKVVDLLVTHCSRLVSVYDVKDLLDVVSTVVNFLLCKHIDKLSEIKLAIS